MDFANFFILIKILKSFDRLIWYIAVDSTCVDSQINAEMYNYTFWKKFSTINFWCDDNDMKDCRDDELCNNGDKNCYDNNLRCSIFK